MFELGDRIIVVSRQRADQEPKFDVVVPDWCRSMIFHTEGDHDWHSGFECNDRDRVNGDICPQLALSIIFGESDGILSDLSGFFSGSDQTFSVFPAGSHFVQLAPHSEPLQNRSPSAHRSYDSKNDSELTNFASPPRHGPFISRVIGLLFLILCGVSMVLAFKGSECADDLGLPFWWFPLVFFVLLSIFFSIQGIRFLNLRIKGILYFLLNIFQFNPFISSAASVARRNVAANVPRLSFAYGVFVSFEAMRFEALASSS